jgi:ribosomal protein S18 acetylase RimI-like enzyme
MDRPEPDAPLEIVPSEAVNPVALAAHDRERWGGDTVVAHGEAMTPSLLPGFAALLAGAIAGHAAYRIVGDRCELVSIEATPEGEGIGSRLLAAVDVAARDAACRTLWLTTTNDNLDALAFYQRRGFRLVALRPGAVDAARASLKPSIPRIGAHGIPLRDELDLERPI